MVSPLSTTGPISIGGLQGYYGGGNQLSSYWDVDWRLPGATPTFSTRMSDLRGTSKEKLRLMGNVYQDTTEYAAGSTISIAVPSSTSSRSFTGNVTYAPLVAIISFAVETTNNNTISAGVVYPTGGYQPIYMDADYSSSSSQVTHSSGYGYTGVVTRMVWVPSSFTGTYTFGVLSNTRVVGTSVHYILPSYHNFSNISTNTYSDVLSQWNVINDSSGTSHTGTYFSGYATVSLISAYSDGIVSIYDSAQRPTVTNTTNKLTTAFGVSDIDEGSGSLLVTFNNLYNSTSATRSYVSDATAWSGP